jgi:hypothetical protein
MGVLWQMGFVMAFQDWMGLERYIEYVQANWWDLHWLVGATIVAGAAWGFVRIDTSYRHAKLGVLAMFEELNRMKGREV